MVWEARRALERLCDPFARRAFSLAVLLALFGGLPAQSGAQTSEVVQLGSTRAWFAGPTARYGHDVLGGLPEWTRLCLSDVCFDLPDDQVFEDITPRLVDLVPGGMLEVIVVNSSFSGGARLEIYGERGMIAATPRIGTRNRWLAPVGAADLDGDGAIEIAFVDRPHLAKTLRIWRFEAGALTEIATFSGVTNHRIGEPFISGGLMSCDGVQALIVASADWSQTRRIAWTGAGYEMTTLGPWTGAAPAC